MQQGDSVHLAGARSLEFKGAGNTLLGVWVGGAKRLSCSLAGAGQSRDQWPGLPHCTRLQWASACHQILDPDKSRSARRLHLVTSNPLRWRCFSHAASPPRRPAVRRPAGQRSVVATVLALVASPPHRQLAWTAIPSCQGQAGGRAGSNRQAGNGVSPPPSALRVSQRGRATHRARHHGRRRPCARGWWRGEGEVPGAGRRVVMRLWMRTSYPVLY